MLYHAMLSYSAAYYTCSFSFLWCMYPMSACVIFFSRKFDFISSASILNLTLSPSFRLTVSTVNTSHGVDSSEQLSYTYGVIYSDITWCWDFWFPTLIGLFGRLHQLSHFSAIALPRLQVQNVHPMNALNAYILNISIYPNFFSFAFELSRGYSISSLLDNVCQPMTKIHNVQCNMIISECKK